METNKLLHYFRMVALVEGCSYLCILCITWPLKIMMNILAPNFIVGMTHGILFTIYCIILLMLYLRKKWDFKTSLILFVASIIPFGTFWADKKYMRD